MSPLRKAHWRPALATLIGCISLGAQGVTPLVELRYNPDITTVLGTPAVTVSPANIVSDLLAGPIVLVNVGSIPAGAKLTAYHRLNNGDALLVTDVTVVLSFLARPKPTLAAP